MLRPAAELRHQMDKPEEGREASLAAAVTGIAALAMLLWFSAAGADELQADQQLLSSRIDSLADSGRSPEAGYRYSVEENPAANAAATGGSFPRSILIPGTETSLRIGGQIDEIAAYFLSGGQPNYSPFSISTGGIGLLETIPLNGGRGYPRSNGIFGQSPGTSRILFATSTPSAWGDVRTYMEFDWYGSNAYVPGGIGAASVSDDLVPRLRYAYGTIGGWLAGQTNSNFRDSDADSETIDFGGDVGGPGINRIPQLRYSTETGLWDSSLAISAEAPETSLETPAGIATSDVGTTNVDTTCPAGAPGSVSTPAASTCTTNLTIGGPAIAKTTAPNVVVNWFVPHPWGHLDLAAVTLPGLDVDDGKFVSRTFVGYGGQLSGVVKPDWLGWASDNYHWHFTVGTGIGEYMIGGPTFALAANYPPSGPPATPAAAALIRVKPVNQIGWTVGYQHFWSPQWRSTVSYGFYHIDIPAQIVGTGQLNSLNSQLQTAHLNLFWRPVSFVDIGIEYMFGRAIAPDNRAGNENVMLSEFRFRF